MSEPSERYRELAGGAKSTLDGIFNSGERPAVEAIVGYEFRGFNHPRWLSLFGARKFVKAFFSTGDAAFGCNTPVRQNELAEEWLVQPDASDPRRFGFFAIDEVGPDSRDRHTHALLLDYGRGHNRWYEPSRLLRDYVVRVDPGSDELLLGRAYIALGPLRIPLAYFLLECSRPIAVEPELPRR